MKGTKGLGSHYYSFFLVSAAVGDKEKNGQVYMHFILKIADQETKTSNADWKECVVVDARHQSIS